MARAASDTAADIFLDGCCSILLRDVTISREPIRAIFGKAASLSLQLGKQRVAVDCPGFYEFRNFDFRVGDKYLEAHASHKLDPDTTDQRLDGKTVRLVIHPAVCCRGTHEAKNYDTEIGVWVKAVVCLKDRGLHV